MPYAFKSTSSILDNPATLVLSLAAELRKKGDIPFFVNRYAKRGEIDEDRFTKAIRDSMVDFLVDRGLDITADTAGTTRFDNGEYDEYFAMAYNHALSTSAGEDDPIDRARSKGTAGVSAWDFSVETFDSIEAQGIIARNILAAGAVDYVYEFGERMGIYRLVDAMVLNWSSGAIDVADGAAAQKLYRYWKLREERSTEEERGLLYGRVLNKGQTKLLTRMVANEHFPNLWHNLMTEVAEYIDKIERLDKGRSASDSSVSKSPIYQATRELQYNLTEYCTGMAHMQAHELYAQLMEGFDLLSDEEIIAHFGGSRRKSLWTVVERLSKAEFESSPNIAAIKSLAVDGNKVFQWIANFNEPTVDHQSFLAFIDSAESYILNSALVGEEMVDEDEEEDDEFEDEFEDDFGDDF